MIKHLLQHSLLCLERKEFKMVQTSHPEAKMSFHIKLFWETHQQDTDRKPDRVALQRWVFLYPGGVGRRFPLHRVHTGWVQQLPEAASWCLRGRGWEAQSHYTRSQVGRDVWSSLSALQQQPFSKNNKSLYSVTDIWTTKLAKIIKVFLISLPTKAAKAAKERTVTTCCTLSTS